MPTPSNTPPLAPDLSPRTRRSVFSNYFPADGADATAPPRAGANSQLKALDQSTPTTSKSLAAAPAPASSALARSFLHQFLARAFEYPNTVAWPWLTRESTHHAARAALAQLAHPATGTLPALFHQLTRQFRPEQYESFHNDYIVAIGHAARGSCPINEIEYGDLKADPLFQPHRLADLGAFYRAFGLELSPDAGERHDHLSVQLEFMAVLCAQEATLLNSIHPAIRPSNQEQHLPPSPPLLDSAGPDLSELCHDAQRKFLRDHLGRWTPAFTRRLLRTVPGGPLAALAQFTLAFIHSECRRFHLEPGSEDLLLRPVDGNAALCDNCGLGQTVPGAA